MQQTRRLSHGNKTGNETGKEPKLPPVVLPMLKLDVGNNTLPAIKDGWHLAHLTMAREGEGVPFSATLFWPQVDGAPWDGLCKIRLHGTSSAHFDKHQYSVAALRNVTENGKWRLEELALGFGPGWRPDSGFVLHAPYADKSLMRNAVMYASSNAMGRWAPGGAMLEMQVNSSAGPKYMGVYWLFEKVSARRLCLPDGKCEGAQGSGRPPKAMPSPGQPGPEEPFLAYCDRKDKRNDRWYVLAWGNTDQWALAMDPSAFSIVWPPDRKPGLGCAGPETLGMAGAVGSALGWDNKQPALSTIDIDSFIDYLILQEFSDNVDGYRFSTYLHRLNGQKLMAGPIWDFDIALGGADYYVNANDSTPVVRHWSWYRNASLLEHFYRSALTDCGGSPGVPEAPGLRQRFAERWQMHRHGALSDEALQARVDLFAAALDASGAADRNFLIWPMDKYVWPNAEVQKNFTDEVSYLQNWISLRVDWLDNGFGIMGAIQSEHWCPAPWVPLDAPKHHPAPSDLLGVALIAVIALAGHAALRRRLSLARSSGDGPVGKSTPLLERLRARLAPLSFWTRGTGEVHGYERLPGGAEAGG